MLSWELPRFVCMWKLSTNNCDGNNSVVYLFEDVYHNYNEVVEPILQLFSVITSQLLCYLSEVCAVWSQSKLFLYSL